MVYRDRNDLDLSFSHYLKEATARPTRVTNRIETLINLILTNSHDKLTSQSDVLYIGSF